MQKMKTVSGKSSSTGEERKGLSYSLEYIRNTTRHEPHWPSYSQNKDQAIELPILFPSAESEVQWLDPALPLSIYWTETPNPNHVDLIVK